MSTANKKKQQRPATPTSENEASGQPGTTAPRSRKKRGRLTVFAIMALVLMLLVGLLPTIIAHSPLIACFARRAAMLDGTLALRSVSIGWFTSASVSGIAICDAQGETVLEAEGLTCDRSLLKLLFNSSNVGTLRIEKPRLSIKLTRDGSNLETVLARLLSGPSTSSRGVDLSVEVVDGEATIVDQETQQTWHVTGLQFALDMSRRLAWPTRVEAAATIDDRRHPGSLALKSHWKASDAPPADPTAWCGLAGTDGDLSLQAATLPLALFQRLAARGVPGLKFDGTLGANIEAQWAGPGNVKLNGNMNGSDLCIESPSLGGDVLRLDKVLVACKAARQDKQVTLEEAKVECEAGNLAASGQVDLGEQGLEKLADLLRQPECMVQGTLDLARLARLLPGTLRVRPGTEITSGQVQLSVRTNNSAAGNSAAGNPASPTTAARTWQARLQTNHLTAVDHGRQISWDKPVSIDAVIHRTDQGSVIDNLTCESDFLRVNGSGTPDRLTASISISLRQLTDDLGRFVDLSGLVLAGDGQGTFQLNRNAAGDFDGNGQLDLRNFQLGIPQRQAWAEESLTLVLGAKGHADFVGPTRLDEATLQIRSGGDQIAIRLLQPVADWSLHAPWLFDLQAEGRLDRWPPRLAPLASMPGLRLGGAYQAAGQVTLSADSLVFTQIKINATQLALAGATWNWSDPAIELNAAGRFEFAASRLQIDMANLVASTIALNTKDLVCSMPGNGPVQISGTIAYQGDLERLQPLFTPTTGGTGLRLAGKLGGKAQVRETDGQIVCQAESDVEQLVVAASSGQSFQEPRVHCVVQCSYQIADNVLKIDQCELSSGVAGARATGQIALRSPGDVQLSGDLSYQWDKLNLLLQPYCGASIQFSGTGTSPISYRGPFSPARGEASAAVQFAGAAIYGFQVGPGELKVHLANGLLRADPVDVACNQGRVVLQPEFRLDRQPMEFRLSAGTLASKIQLDQAACRSALKYVVPILASATQSQGQFSVQLDGCRIPIGDLNRAEIAGRIVVHSATMSPGPLVEQLASLLVASPSLVRIPPESVIQFRMTGGRIYHQGLLLEFPNVTMRTYGSVGLDDSLKLMVETSVPLAWLPSNAVTDALRKQKMQIPVGGTLKSPQIDLAELARVKSQLLGNLGVLQSELGNQLNRFLQPKP